MMLPARAALWTYAFIEAFGLTLASVGLAGAARHLPARRSTRTDPVAALRQQ